MKRLASTIALLIAVGTLAACAENTTTGEPQDSSGQPSVQAPTPGLAGTSWQLRSAESTTSGVLDFPVTLEFDKSTLSGQAAINTYNAAYHAGESGTLEISDIATTRMAGSDKAMAAEDDYLKVLGQVNGFRVSPTELDLTTDGTISLTYAVAGAPPSDSASPTGGSQEAASQKVADSVVGMPQEDAEAAVTDAGLAFRVTSIDGQPQVATSDYRPDRVNVEVEQGKVTAATIG